VIVHDRNRNIPEVIDRLVRYAPADAQAMIDEGRTFSAREMLSTLGSKLYKQFIKGNAFQDGVPGFLRAGILVGHHFYVWAAFWQLSGGKRTEEDDRVMNKMAVRIAIGWRLLKLAGAPIDLTRAAASRVARMFRN
jgi:hypothetical protein